MSETKSIDVTLSLQDREDALNGSPVVREKLNRGRAMLHAKGFQRIQHETIEYGLYNWPRRIRMTGVKP